MVSDGTGYLISYIIDSDIKEIYFNDAFLLSHFYVFGGDMASTGVRKYKLRAGVLSPRKKAETIQTPTLITSTH